MSLVPQRVVQGLGCGTQCQSAMLVLEHDAQCLVRAPSAHCLCAMPGAQHLVLVPVLVPHATLCPGCSTYGCHASAGC